MRKLMALMALIAALGLLGWMAPAARAQGDAEIAAGQEAARTGDLATAVQQFRAACAAAPDFAAAHFFLGQALYRQAMATGDMTVRPGLLNDAVTSLKRAIELAPDIAEAHYHLGLTYLQQQVFDLALAEFNAEMEVSRPQGREEIYNGIGLAYAGLHRYFDAAEAIESAIKLDNNYSEAQYNLAQVYYRMERYDDCVDMIDRLNRIMQDYRVERAKLNKQTRDQKRTPDLTEEWVAQEYRHCIEFASRQPEAFKLQGRANHALRDYSRARASYRLSMREFYDGSPSDVDARTYIVAESVAEARDHIVRDNTVLTPWTMLTQAEEEADKILKDDPNYAPAHDVQGKVYFLQADVYRPDEDRGIKPKTYADARASFEKAVEIYAARQSDLLALKALRDPTNYAVALRDLGEVALVEEKPDEAARVLAQAVQLDPENHDALALLARARGQLGDTEAALALMREALEGERVDPALYNVQGELLMDLGRPTEAARAFQAALDAEPSMVDARVNLGDAFFASESWTNARQAYTEALSNLPGSPLIKLSETRADVWRNIGLALSADGAYTEAVKAFNEALALRPSYLAAQVSLGSAYAAQNDFGAAERAFRTALQLAEVEENAVRADVHAQLSNMYERMGRLHDAYYQASQALALAPDNQQALALRDSIRKQLTGGTTAGGGATTPAPEPATGTGVPAPAAAAGGPG